MHPSKIRRSVTLRSSHFSLRVYLLPVLCLPVLCFAAFSLSGCGQIWHSDSTPAALPPMKEINSVELFLSRSALHQTEFEHFKISGDLFFSECGKIQRGRNTAEQSAVNSPSGNILDIIRAHSWKLYSEFESTRPALDAPGKNSDLTDPGELRLTLNIEGKPFKIDTSLDSISPPENNVAQELKVLTEFIRGAGNPPLCSNVEFFGIKAKVPAS